MASEEEFTMFFNSFYPSLCRFLECMLVGRSVAQDIAQESFMQLYRTGLNSFPEGEARFWLYRVARNLALNELNRRQTRNRLFEKVVDAFTPKAKSPQEEFEMFERKELILEMLKFLPEHQRSALLLREQEEMSYDEIARVLNVSESKVKVDIFRARTSMRERWTRMQNASAKAAK